VAEMSVREFRSLFLKMVNDLKEDSNKQINELKISIQDLEKKVSNMQEKFSKEMEIMKKKVEMLEMKTSKQDNNTPPTVDSIICRQDQSKERLSEMKDKIEEILYSNHHKDQNKSSGTPSKDQT
jgi:predicted  nucleic acid-binding Zn-ribbon protein